MKNIFLDTNVVIDYLSDRGSFSNASTELFDLYANNNQKVYIAAVSYTNIYYILMSLEGGVDLVSVENLNSNSNSNSNFGRF